MTCQNCLHLPVCKLANEDISQGTKVKDVIHDCVNFIEEKSEKMTKLCEISVDRADSLKELIYHLIANGYIVQTSIIWKEFPYSGIDHWQIAIFDDSEE